MINGQAEMYYSKLLESCRSAVRARNLRAIWFALNKIKVSEDPDFSFSRVCQHVSEAGGNLSLGSIYNKSSLDYRTLVALFKGEQGKKDKTNPGSKGRNTTSTANIGGQEAMAFSMILEEEVRALRGENDQLRQLVRSVGIDKGGRLVQFDDKASTKNQRQWVSTPVVPQGPEAHALGLLALDILASAIDIGRLEEHGMEIRDDGAICRDGETLLPPGFVQAVMSVLNMAFGIAAKPFPNEFPGPEGHSRQPGQSK